MRPIDNYPDDIEYWDFDPRSPRYQGDDMPYCEDCGEQHDEYVECSWTEE